MFYYDLDFSGLVFVGYPTFPKENGQRELTVCLKGKSGFGLFRRRLSKSLIREFIRFGEYDRAENTTPGNKKMEKSSIFCCNPGLFLLR